MTIAYAPAPAVTVLDAPTLTAYLGRTRAHDSAPSTPVREPAESADAALFEAVNAQAQAARAVASSVADESDQATAQAAPSPADSHADSYPVSRTASWATTPTVEHAAPHAAAAAQPAPVVSTPDVTGGVTVDPAAWLAGQLHRFSNGDEVDPYAELMLRRAGFAPARR